MISDLDETIKQLLIKKGSLDPSVVDISFDIPDREWSAALSKPTLSIYLYDIRENHELRGTEWITEKRDKGLVTRKKTASRIDLSYLVTVWTNDVTDQHRLMWQVLATLFRYPIIPTEVLQGAIAGQDYPIQTTTAQPDGLFSNPSDFWAALDNEIKPAINYVVTVPLDLAFTVTAPEVKTTVFDVKPPETESERQILIIGTLRRAGEESAKFAGAKVVATDIGMTAEADDEGRFYFPRIPAGKHSFQVIVSGKKVKELPVTVPAANYDLEI